MADDLSSSVSQLSAQTSASLSAADVMLDAQALKLAQQKTAIYNNILSASDMINQQMEQAMSAIYTAIEVPLQQFKKIPPKLKSVVDIDAAAAGVYAQVDKFSESMQTIANNIIISSLVPIAPSDYYADPDSYPILQEMQTVNNTVTNDDCLESGYTKVKYELNMEYLNKLKQQLNLPVENRDVVAMQMEALFNATVTAAWASVQPIVGTLGSVAAIPGIGGMVNGVTDSIDGIVTMISTKVDEKTLNAKWAALQAEKAKKAAEAEKARLADIAAGKSPKSLIDKAMDSASSGIDAVSNAASAAVTGAVDAFKNLKAPEFPDDVKETFNDFTDAVVMVKDNINNIYIVLMLQMIGQIMKCLTDIAGVIGVPSIPAPLNTVPQMVADVHNVMKFVRGLPMSMVNSTKAIVKRKIKAAMVAKVKLPPPQVPTKEPLPPTSKDVVVPTISWDDVVKKLTDEYGFTAKNAKRVTSAIQQFYDGSGVKADGSAYMSRVITDYNETNVGEHVNRTPVYTPMQRVNITAIECFNTWLAANMHVIGEYNGKDVYSVTLPYVGYGVDGYTQFWQYEKDENGEYNTKQVIDVSKDWGTRVFSSIDD